MKKVIILRKIHVAMKCFAPPFSIMEKKPEHIQTSAADLLHAVLEEENLDWCKSWFAKTKQDK